MRNCCFRISLVIIVWNCVDLAELMWNSRCFHFEEFHSCNVTLCIVDSKALAAICYDIAGSITCIWAEFTADSCNKQAEQWKTTTYKLISYLNLPFSYTVNCGFPLIPIYIFVARFLQFAVASVMSIFGLLHSTAMFSYFYIIAKHPCPASGSERVFPDIWVWNSSII